MYERPREALHWRRPSRASSLRARAGTIALAAGGWLAGLATVVVAHAFGWT